MRVAPEFKKRQILIHFASQVAARPISQLPWPTRAIRNGFNTLFVTTAELIDDLLEALREGHLAEVLQTYAHLSLLTGDEVGYVTYDTDAANMLFHVVNDRQCSMQTFH